MVAERNRSVVCGRSRSRHRWIDGRYVQESAFRLNEGNVSRKTLARLDSFIAGVAGKRLTYAGLIQ